eukprot:CCRYP_005997-RA/>CCRYP_005997-RA protein AED:0.17 eAED:0.17 QI:0/0/0/0.66/0/0/3/0/113
MKDLTRRGKLYKVPPRCLDDFYWMVASIITKNQMHDNRLELLGPRLFRLWYGCHIVNYNFTAFVMDESVDGNEIRFAQADFYSREIQGNESPLRSNPSTGEGKSGGHLAFSCE